MFKNLFKKLFGKKTNTMETGIGNTDCCKMRVERFRMTDGTIVTVDTFADFDRLMNDPNATLIEG